MQTLTEDQIQTRLDTEAPEWSDAGGSIQRTYQFDDFLQAIVFVNKVADAAESAQHHPDILIRYNKVTLTLTTHDAGGITDNDFALADSADSAATS